MSEVRLTIDGSEVVAAEGMTLLDAARTVGIEIPTLCHHDKLEPYGGCRICTVEVEAWGRTKYVVGCVYPVEADIVVRTRSEKIDQIRKTILELMLAHAPDSHDLAEMAKEYKADPGKYRRESSFCIHCGLCVRYCDEIKGKNAVTFVDQGASREISFIPEIAAKECWDCKECFPLCPTSALQAAYVLARSFEDVG
ncbi:MAG: (2Fe-2S)-binding protein [Deltaproteobacteria bacterium]|nr:MAG: (2Fe-2S)-binding protein [Deltaproteobacteria bacterium]